MSWLKWVVVALALLNAGYMVVDGTRALTKGDYFTPSSGEHKGELGPWARVVNAIGIEPRSTGMKTFFVIYGLAWIVVIVGFAREQAWSWLGMLVFALGSLWYMTVGTVLGGLVAILLFVPAVRDLFRG
ncbi:MAG: hypothetical protein M3161_07520 [Actinomycetota bacterium]|nr:hypothetical protein [Actinomycetota bacterium]